MAYKLYNAPQSTCSQRVRFVLNAKGLTFAEEKLDLLAGDQLKPDYLALNPNGVVPTLDHDGQIVIDSSVIVEYLDEVEPDAANFTPRDPVKRAAMRALMRFIDEMPAAAVRVPTFNLAFLPRFAAMSEDEFIAFAESKPLRKEFMLAMGRKGFPQKDMDSAMARLRRTYERMDEVDPRQWRAVAAWERHHARRRVGDAGDRADGRPQPRGRLGRPAAGGEVVRPHSRAAGVQADILSGQPADGAVSAFAEGRGVASAQSMRSAVAAHSGRMAVQPLVRCTFRFRPYVPGLHNTGLVS